MNTNGYILTFNHMSEESGINLDCQEVERISPTSVVIHHKVPTRYSREGSTDTALVERDIAVSLSMEVKKDTTRVLIKATAPTYYWADATSGGTAQRVLKKGAPMTVHTVVTLPRAAAEALAGISGTLTRPRHVDEEVTLLAGLVNAYSGLGGATKIVDSAVTAAGKDTIRYGINQLAIPNSDGAPVEVKDDDYDAAGPETGSATLPYLGAGAPLNRIISDVMNSGRISECACLPKDEYATPIAGITFVADAAQPGA